MTDPELVCFDLDGVLVDTRRIHWEALNLAFAECGFRVLSWDEHRPLDGLPTLRKLDLLGVPRSVAVVKQRHTERLLADLPADPTKAELFARIPWPVAVVSNAVRSTVDLCLTQLGLTADVVVSNEHCRHPKPNPAPYLTAMAKAGVSPSRTAVVEDRDCGVESAVAACVRTVIRVHQPDEVNCENLGADGGQWSPFRRAGIHRPETVDRLWGPVDDPEGCRLSP